MLIAEALILWAYDAEKGVCDARIGNLDQRLAGALLAQLHQLGRLELVRGQARPISGVAKPRVQVRGAGSAGHRELDGVLAVVAGQPKTPKKLVLELSDGLRLRLLNGLASDGVLRRQESRLTVRWLAVDSTIKVGLHERLQAVLLGASPNRTEAALLALGAGTRLVSRLAPGLGAKELTARLKQVAEDSWVIDATRQAIGAANQTEAKSFIPVVSDLAELAQAPAAIKGRWARIKSEAVRRRQSDQTP